MALILAQLPSLRCQPSAALMLQILRGWLKCGPCKPVQLSQAALHLARLLLLSFALLLHSRPAPGKKLQIDCVNLHAMRP